MAAAYRLARVEADLDVILLEAADRLGGVLETTRRDEFLIEGAADNFLTTPPQAVELCRQLGMEDQLIGTDPTRRSALVVKGGRLYPIPAGFLIMAASQIWPIVTTPILSLRGKLRLAMECFVSRSRSEADESLAAFVKRRMGREVFDRLVQPLIGGIYTGDPELLSINATMPRFRQMERDHGSLTRAMFKQRPKSGAARESGARYGQFAAPQGGMASILQALAQQLPEESVRLGSPVEKLSPADGQRWQIQIGGDNPLMLEVDGVVVAVPAYRAANLFSPWQGEVAEQLRGIEYASCAVVSLAYRREQIGHALDGFGFVVPLRENRMILSCSFSSLKYAGRAPEGSVLMRVFIGGACQPGLLKFSDDELTTLAERELEDLLQVQGPPIISQMRRYDRAMPQYYVGHQDRISAVESALDQYPTIALAGSAFNGVGIPSCIQTGHAAADKILERLDLLTRSPNPVASS